MYILFQSSPPAPSQSFFCSFYRLLSLILSDCPTPSLPLSACLLFISIPPPDSFSTHTPQMRWSTIDTQIGQGFSDRSMANRQNQCRSDSRQLAVGNTASNSNNEQQRQVQLKAIWHSLTERNKSTLSNGTRFAFRADVAQKNQKTKIILNHPSSQAG